MASSRTRRDWRRRSACFSLLSVLPVGYLLVVSLTDDEPYSAIAARCAPARASREYRTARGRHRAPGDGDRVGVGFALARVSLPRKGCCGSCSRRRVLLPPYIVGLAWTYLGAANGWLATVAGVTWFWVDL